jgi:hypothetical protein
VGANVRTDRIGREREYSSPGRAESLCRNSVVVPYACEPVSNELLCGSYREYLIAAVAIGFVGMFATLVVLLHDVWAHAGPKYRTSLESLRRRPVCAQWQDTTRIEEPLVGCCMLSVVCHPLHVVRCKAPNLDRLDRGSAGRR